MKCSKCATESTGNFCPACGHPLNADACLKCAAPLLPGARFCTKCGTAAGTAGLTPLPVAAGSGRLPWYLGGAVLLIIIIIFTVPLLRSQTTPTPPDMNAPFAGGSDATGTPPPLSDNPRENADRLFNRIMAAREQGNEAEVVQFTPMAVQAYAMAEPLDNDGLYHLATIYTAAGDHANARATADRILANAPWHLLGLGAAGEAAEAAGDAAAARTYFTKFEEVYDAEIARQLPEYLDHERIFPRYREAATRYAPR